MLTAQPLMLSRAELTELTGRKTRSGMIAYLDSVGLQYRLNGDGWPIVSRGNSAPSMVIVGGVAMNGVEATAA